MNDESSALPFSRWWLVVAAAGTIGVAGTYQFVWSSIRAPIGMQVGASEAGLGTVFTLFIFFQTVTQFPAGWVRDRWGPRVPMIGGAILLAIGYAGTAVASSLLAVYLFFTLGGIGAGATYTVAVNTPVKWFDEHRGLATGIVMMAYSGVSFLVIPLVRNSPDIGLTLLGMGALVGGVTLVAGVLLRDPGPLRTAEKTDASDEAAPSESDASMSPTVYTWREAIRTWQFWLLYIVFLVVNGVGLMVIGKVVNYAEALALSPTAATTSASMIALAGAVGIPVVSGLSDRLGRERTLAVSLCLCGIALGGAVVVGRAGYSIAFVAFITGAEFFRSPVFGIFPPIIGSYFGTARSSENYATLYTAKLWGGLFAGTVSSSLIVAIGWSPTFLLGAVLMSVVGVATFFLRPVQS